MVLITSYCYIGCKDEVTTWYYSTKLIEVVSTMIWVKDWNEDREDHDVDIFNIIQKVQDTVIHLKKVDEEQMADHTRK